MAAPPVTKPVSKYQGTVKATPNYTGETDCTKLRNAMKGLGTNEKEIIEVFARRTNAERQKLFSMYKTMYAKDLKEELASEIGGGFKEIIDTLLMPLAEFEAREIARAMKGLGTNESLLIEILATRSNAQIHELVKNYKRVFGMNLEDNLRSETSGYFERLCVSLANGGRLENQKPDQAKAKNDAEGLYNAGEKTLGTDEAFFIQILVSQSYDQLKLVFEEYDKLSKKTIEEAIASEMSGDLKDGLLTIAKCVRNQPAYFAEKLYKAMKGLGTNEKTVVRVIVTRCEVDMVQIKEEFEKAYGTTLEEFVGGDFSGDTKKVLLALIRS